MTREEALKQIEEKVEAAKALIQEAELLAKEHKVTFRVGMIRQETYNEELDEYVPVTDENKDGAYNDDREHVSIEAGWSPSGLNC